MKKLVMVVLAACLLPGIVGCSGDGGSNELVGLALLGGHSVTDQTAPMKFMEFMYNDTEGKRLNDIAMGGVGTVAPGVQNVVNQISRITVFERLGVCNQNIESSNWWERLDVTADNVVQYFNQQQGMDALTSFLITNRRNSISMPSNGRTGDLLGNDGGYMFREWLALQPNFSDMITVEIVFEWMWARDLNTATTYDIALCNFIQSFKSFRELQTQIAQGFEETNYHISQMEGWLREKDLRDARVALQSKIDEIGTFANVDALYRDQLIMDFFTNGYEELYNKAFVSACDRTALLNARPGFEKVPGIMLISDVLLMKEMSDTRMTFSNSYYSGVSLLKYRANIAKNDLVRLKQIKASFLKDLNVTCLVPSEILAILVSWEITLRAHIAVVYGYEVDEVKLADPNNVGPGSGTFGDYCGIGNNSNWGEVLLNAAAMPLAGLFNEGDDLSSVFDIGTSGSLSVGKALRIVANGINVVADMGLIPVVKNINSSTQSPPRNQCYIDSAKGQFILPRPIYWNRMASDANMNNPEIGTSYACYGMTASRDLHSYPTGKFGSGMCLWGGYLSANRWDVLPGGWGYHPDEGTFSCWIKYVVGPCNPIIEDTFYFGDNGATYVLINWNTIGIMINGTWASFAGINPTGGMHHIYITFNRNAPAGGKTVRVFVDGAEACSTTWRWNSGFCQVRSLVSGPALSDSYSYMDNLKIWNHVVSDSPEFEYNGGAGRENALHEIYGAANGYTPTLTGNGNGVGFYHLKN